MNETLKWATFWAGTTIFALLAYIWFTTGWNAAIGQGRRTRSSRPNSAMIARLEHELGIAGHNGGANCLRCNPAARMPARFSKGGIVIGPTKPMRLSAACSPDGSGSLDVVYADECFLSGDGICVRRDDLHAAAAKAVKVKPDRWWICPLHD